jgi:26S proteasome non-ATPase regulatory subunit 9
MQTFTNTKCVMLQGLQVEDQLVQFGTLNAGNFETLQDVAKIVQHCVNKEIPITVRRKTRYMRMHLVPKTWSGRGLLGCNIVPLESVER